MTDRASPRRGRPPRLTRAQILRAALQIADGSGLDGLTMRRLGAELGVDPMAVYGHLPDKAALVDGLVEIVMGEIVVPVATGDWMDDLRAVTRSARTTLLMHPAVVPLLGTRPPVTPEAFAVVEAITAILLAAGFTAEQAMDGFDCAGRLLVGHALAEAGRPPGGEVDGGEEEHRRTQATLPAAAFPALARIRRADVQHDPDRLFELALDGLVLSMADRLDDAPAVRTPRP